MSEPKKYRKRPVEIEAMEFTEETAEAVAAWCGGRLQGVRTVGGGWKRPRLLIYTMEGTMQAKVGDYVIKGTQGEFYPCKPASFEDTFEEV